MRRKKSEEEEVSCQGVTRKPAESTFRVLLMGEEAEFIPL